MQFILFENVRFRGFKSCLITIDWIVSQIFHDENFENPNISIDFSYCSYYTVIAYFLIRLKCSKLLKNIQEYLLCWFTATVFKLTGTIYIYIKFKCSHSFCLKIKHKITTYWSPDFLIYVCYQKNINRKTLKKYAVLKPPEL